MVLKARTPTCLTFRRKPMCLKRKKIRYLNSIISLWYEIRRFSFICPSFRSHLPQKCYEIVRTYGKRYYLKKINCYHNCLSLELKKKKLTVVRCLSVLFIAGISGGLLLKSVYTKNGLKGYSCWSYLCFTP